MTGIIIRLYKTWNKYVTYRQFQGAQLDHVKLGPELNKRFEIRHPQNLSVGYKTVISGYLFINAWGENWKVLPYRQGTDHLFS